MLSLLLLASIGAVSAGNTQTHKHPHQVSVTDASGIHICGGSIIDEFWVLTAASCVVAEQIADLRIVINDGNLDDALSHTLLVVFKMSHPNYNQGAGHLPNDVALLKTNTSMVSLVSHQRVQMADSSDGDFKNRRCTISGWGGSGSEANKLHDTVGKVLSNEDCSTYWGTSYSSSAHICFSAGTCNGFAGGPMICGHILAGVMSWPVGPCDPTKPLAYARVSSYNSWITNTMNAN